jgi:hypothetical protein
MEITAELFLELSQHARYEPEEYDGKDRRAIGRVQISLDAAVLRLSRGIHAKPMAVRVRDLSIRGVGFECEERFRVEEEFALRLTRADGSPVWIQCVVGRWTPISDRLFAIGAKFTKLLSNSQSNDGPEHHAHCNAA